MISPWVRLDLSSVKHGSGTQETITHTAQLLATGLFCRHCLPSTRDSLKLIATQMAILKLSGSKDKKNKDKNMKKGLACKEKRGLTGLKESRE